VSLAISATGAIVPSTLDTWWSATARVRGPSRPSSAANSGVPSARAGSTLHVARARQGSVLLWCSAEDSTTSSSGPRPSEAATRLMPSVVPWVNTSSPGEAPTCAAARWRTAS
jgi:hypothetical protein